MNLQKVIALITRRGNFRYPSDARECMEERRQHPRHIVDLPLDYTDLDGDERTGFVLDASEGGLQAYLRERIKKGSLLKVNLFYRENSELHSIMAMVKVVWCESAGRKFGREYKHGLAFQAFHKEGQDRLRMLLESRVEPPTA